MEQQKVINLLDNTSNQPTKFITKNQAEINDGSRGTYNKNIQIKFNTLCGYGDMYILVNETITLTGAGADDAVK